MASIMNPSSMLADSLAEFSRAAHKAFAELESQSRLEVTRALAETRSALSARDKALDDLHKGMLEVQSWKQESAASKSALIQAELTISHQTETIASHADTITQLKRELAQWKDQARNWQEHFLRVEQERCAISSKLEEVMSERLQYALPSPHSSNTFTPAKRRYTQVTKSTPSTTSKLPLGTPLTHQFSSSKSSNRIHHEGDLSSPQDHSHKPAREAIPPNYAEVQYVDSEQPAREPPRHAASEKSKKNHASQSHRVAQQSQPTASSSNGAHPSRSSTVIRRVQAVINVKREESEDEQAEFSAQSRSSQLKEESTTRASASAVTPAPRHDEQQQPKLRRRREDASPSPHYEEEDEAPAKRGRLRQRSQINYEESDYEEDEDEDELMMGAEDNHEEVYGMRQVEKQPLSQKRRRINGR
ncbi:hypothetical protein CVT24_004584 [Panaeolus cyanescens]|uniref:Uncharacterized protein n=1 Tax=Panaeolus cyanescens TaxID=181874 RepID=A0A409W1C5_9AGAR|nr:hypothetical protein CVT24_004584 [Panaeolus cyanescens]